MPAVAVETAKSRSVSFERGNQVVNFEWLAYNAATESEALAAAKAIAPAGDKYMGLWLTGYGADPIAPRVWTVKAKFGVPDTDPTKAMPDQSLNDGSHSPTDPAQGDTAPLGPEWQVRSSFNPGKVYRAIIDPQLGGTPSRYYGRAGWTVLDFKDAIGTTWRNGEHAPEGADLNINARQIVTETVDVARVSLTYFDLLARLTGSVNSVKFYAWQPGECLFLGVDGRYKPSGGSASQPDGWNLTFTYAINKTRKALTDSIQIADGLYLPVGHQIDGWDLIDVYSQPTQITVEGVKKVINQTKQFAIHRVFPRMDLRVLRL